MRLVSLNCNGIRAAFKKGLAEFLEQTQADVVCLQEVRAKEAQIPTMFLRGEHHWLEAEKGGYSGVGVVSELPILNVRHGIGDPLFDTEGRVQKIEFEKFTVVNVYIPSGTTGDVRQAEKYRFLDLFYDYVSDVIRKQPRTIICGDFNIAHHEIDLKNWKTNKNTSGFLEDERSWLTKFSTLGLTDVVRQLAGPEQSVYSWWSQRAGARDRDVGWRLDYQWATQPLASKCTAFEIPRIPVFSDHAPVIVDFTL